MDSFEFNKIAGAVLGTALMVFGLHELAGIIYHPHEPEKPGFVVAVPEGEAPAGGEAAAEAEPEAPGRVARARCSPRPIRPRARLASRLCGLPRPDQGRSEQGRAPISGASSVPCMAPTPVSSIPMPWPPSRANPGPTSAQRIPDGPGKGDPRHQDGLRRRQEGAGPGNIIAYLATLSDAPVPFPAP